MAAPDLKRLKPRTRGIRRNKIARDDVVACFIVDQVAVLPNKPMHTAVTTIEAHEDIGGSALARGNQADFQELTANCGRVAPVANRERQFRPLPACHTTSKKFRDTYEATSLSATNRKVVTAVDAVSPSTDGAIPNGATETRSAFLVCEPEKKGKKRLLGQRLESNGGAG